MKRTLLFSSTLLVITILVCCLVLLDVKYYLGIHLQHLQYY